MTEAEIRLLRPVLSLYPAVDTKKVGPTWTQYWSRGQSVFITMMDGVTTDARKIPVEKIWEAATWNTEEI
jgi:hypothetical protein